MATKRLLTIEWQALKQGLTLSPAPGRKTRWWPALATSGAAVLVIAALIAAIASVSSTEPNGATSAADSRAVASSAARPTSRRAAPLQPTIATKDRGGDYAQGAGKPPASAEVALAGRWELLTPSGRIPLEFYRSFFGKLRVRLAGRHQAIRAVEGTVSITGSTGRIDGLAWSMWREGKLRPSTARLQRINDRTLTLSTDVVQPDSRGRYYVTGRVEDFTLSKTF